MTDKNNKLIIEQRGVILGQKDEYYTSLERDMNVLGRMFFKYVCTEDELVEQLYTFEPMLILMELDPKTVAAAIRLSKLNKYRQAVSVGLCSADSEGLKRFSDEFIVTDTVVKTGVSRKDSLSILKVYRQNLMYGMNVKSLAKQMPIVTDLVWHDVSYDEKFYYHSISDKLDKLGVRKELAGHRYLIAAIAMQAATRDAPEPIKLYKNIADYYDTTPLAVEKAIRYAIETAWIVGDIEYQHVVFGMSIDEDKGKPTNAEFIARLALEY